VQEVKFSDEDCSKGGQCVFNNGKVNQQYSLGPGLLLSLQTTANKVEAFNNRMSFLMLWV
jgi:hypothetical protein